MSLKGCRLPEHQAEGATPAAGQVRSCAGKPLTVAWHSLAHPAGCPLSQRPQLSKAWELPWLASPTPALHIHQDIWFSVCPCL